jgi:hypothetical protein
MMHYVVDHIPRFDGSFHLIDPDFDMENDVYVRSNVLYLVTCGGIGLLLLAVTVSILVMRNFCRCCKLERYYTMYQITRMRVSLAFVSFLLEGLLIYGYFANSDLIRSTNKLERVFRAEGPKVVQQVKTLESVLPLAIGSQVYDQRPQVFHNDLKFTSRWIEGQGRQMSNVWNTIENIRLPLLLSNLILATVGSAIGAAAGALMHHRPMIWMVIFNAVAMALIFFSTGCHFAGSKLIGEYCDEIEPYLRDDVTEPIPKRLQCFVPCVDSPVIPFVRDYFVVNAAILIEALNSKLRNTVLWEHPNISLRTAPPRVVQRQRPVLRRCNRAHPRRGGQSGHYRRPPKCVSVRGRLGGLG